MVKVEIEEREAYASLSFINTWNVPSHHPWPSLLLTGKDVWNLEQTLSANSFTFELLNSHCFTTKNAGLVVCLFVREAGKGNNYS